MLQQHPDISFGFDPKRSKQLKLKEVRFFDIDSRYSAGLKLYKSFFKKCQTKIISDISPGYCIIPTKRIQLASKIMPNANIFLCIRNPVDRHWSHINKQFFNGKFKIEDISEKSFSQWINDPMKISFGEYDKIYQNWNKFFKESQIHLIYTGEISRSPRMVMNRVFDVLKVAKLPLNNLKEKINHNTIYKNRFQNILEQIYEPKIERMKTFFGKDIINKWN